MDTSTPFKWRHFEAEIILLCAQPLRLGGNDAGARTLGRS